MPSDPPIAVEQQLAPVETSEDIAMEECVEDGACVEGAYAEGGGRVC